MDHLSGCVQEKKTMESKVLFCMKGKFSALGGL